MTVFEAARLIVNADTFRDDMHREARTYVDVNAENRDAPPEAVAAWLAATPSQRDFAARELLDEVIL